jgi:hypothetical protein
MVKWDVDWGFGLELTIDVRPKPERAVAGYAECAREQWSGLRRLDLCYGYHPGSFLTTNMTLRKADRFAASVCGVNCTVVKTVFWSEPNTCEDD